MYTAAAIRYTDTANMQYTVCHGESWAWNCWFVGPSIDDHLNYFGMRQGCENSLSFAPGPIKIMHYAFCVLSVLLGVWEVFFAWQPFYAQCPVCVANGLSGIPKGFWHHPGGGKKCEFKTTKPPNTYRVEINIKGRIRCNSCRSTEDARNAWRFKCRNHDYQLIHSRQP